MKSRITLTARVLLTAALLGFAFLFNSLQRDGPKTARNVAVKASGNAADIGRSADALASAKAVSSCDGAVIIPVSGVRQEDLINTFADARAEGRRHDAIDIMAPVGTEIIAAAPGVVEKIFHSEAGGNTVYARSTDRKTIYYYAHLDRYAENLREGNRLRSGDPIGSVGYSGNADPAAPHLHFAMTATLPSRKWWEGGEALNPFVYLTRSRASTRPCVVARS